MAQKSIARIRAVESLAAERIKRAGQEASERKKTAEIAASDLYQKILSETNNSIQASRTEAEHQASEEIKPYLEEGAHRVAEIKALEREKIEAAIQWVVGRIVK